MRIVFHAEAENELLSDIDFYNARQKDLGRLYWSELHRVLETIREFPNIGPISSYHGLRKIVLPSFPHYVIYKINHDWIQVLAIAHGKRQPGYWKERGAGVAHRKPEA